MSTKFRRVLTCIRIFRVLALAVAVAACDSDDDDDDHEGGVSAASEATATSGASGATAPGTSAGESQGDGDRVCGILDPTISACDGCAVEQCCDVFAACGGDSLCNDCFYAQDKPTECWTHPAWMAVADCVNGPCGPSCNGTGGGSGGEGGNACGDISCTDTPQGHSLCNSSGCGGCSFGKCLLF